MDWFRLNNTDVVYLCLVVLAVTAAGYLLSVRRASKGTMWLAATACVLSAHLVVHLALSVLDLERLAAAVPALLGLDAALLAGVGVAGVGFAYTSFGGTLGSEGRWALRVAAGALVVLLTVAVGQPALASGVVAGSLALTVVAFVWAAVVLLRQPSRGDAGVRATRMAAGVMLVGAVVGATSYWAQRAVDGEVLRWLAVLAFLLGIVVLYVNHGREPTTLGAKVVAFVLAAALTALSGAVALGNRPDDLARSSGVDAPEREAVLLTPEAGGGYRLERTDVPLGSPGLPLRVNAWDASEVDLGFAFAFGDSVWTSMRVAASGHVTFGDRGTDVSPTIAPLYAPSSAESWGREAVFVRRESDQIAVTWLTASSSIAEARENATFQLVLDSEGRVTLRYGDVGFVRTLVRGVLPRGLGGGGTEVGAGEPLPARVPPGGFIQRAGAAYDQHVSRRLLPWVGLVLGVTGVALVGIPLLLQTSVTRPVRRLLAGVRRVGEGDLAVSVPVSAADEIGQLTEHFNRMTASLRESRDALSAYAETLEERVAERTEELGLRNDELAAEKQALAQAIDELKAAQARLIEQEKLASLGRLTSGIAHEIKNPLNFVTNFADLSVELAQEAASEADPEERAALLDDLRSNAEKIAEHGRRADAIVRGMMDHAQGGTEEVRAVDLNALVEEHVRLAQEAWVDGREEVPVEVTCDLDPAVGSVRVAPRGMGRVVVNLVANALDAVEEREGGGRVVVRTREDGEGVRIEVEDDGVGMDDEAQSRMFEPFYTSKPTGQGNVGLGLSLSRDAVRGHGGRVEVESEPDAGTTITVSLPRG
ncbi:sensor histidine kinase [Rubrivirga sp. IMCC43871]|uniref:sensor histidine kinase n=1 Tax=Rubrivirga sp. IMCC43871 TaxID=3391575 RepID=UPI00398FA451